MMIFTPLATQYFLSVQRFLECLLCAKHVFDSGPSKDNRVGCFPGVGPQPSKRLTVLLDSCNSRPAREVAERERDSAVKEAREK